MRYIPHTADDKAKMLEAIGVASIDELFRAIPADLQLGRPLALPSGMAESDLRAHLRTLAEQNVAMGRAALHFLGAGTYRHYIPCAVSQLLLRGELYTAYTPYQPEIAQGTLQIIFEFQTMVSELLGIEVVNASMYDGATALAEAALMALRCQRNKPARIIVAKTIHPQYRDVTRLFVESADAAIVETPWGADGTADLAAIERELVEGAAAVCLGYPNFFGGFDDLAAARKLCDAHGAMLIATFTEAVAFGLVTPPGALGADIIAGEGQSLGVWAQNGGPHLGLFGTREKFLRQMPGRLAGESVDTRGNRAFVLTMSTREQHIRREKATSNICTNVALMATAATIAMTLTGPDGLATVARASHLRAEEAKAALTKLPGFAALFGGPTFNEFVVRTPIPAEQLVDRLAAQRIAPGLALGTFDAALDHALLVTATELTTSDEIARLAEALAAAV